jgi:LuxR family transcriptional regulator, maltose regulon positive regulatory protein
MAHRLLETKLQVPMLHRTIVPRTRLIEHVRRGVESRLTLVSAPAGFGKTTLLVELAGVASDHAQVAWLSLEPGDNDPVVFWKYLASAIDRAIPGVGAGALALLDAPQTPVEVVVRTLLNDLAAIPTGIVLLLDDYHVVDGAQFQDAMSFLVEHLPPTAHLVIGTRADPHLPLARLRARGELVEIRASALRFSSEEATAYLNEAMGLALTTRDVEALEHRTEGWIAALQLAALSLRGRDDAADFIASFAGDDRYVVDFLVEEVLQRQTAAVRDFLLKTSILARMSGPVCDAITEGRGSSATLEELDRANLFLVALDDQRHWYRYHQLFADMLRARLLDERPDLLPVLHRRASDWFEHHDDRSQAISHALAGSDFARAADLIELAIPDLGKARQEATLRRWLEAIPEPLFGSRPILATGFAGALMQTGELKRVDALLRMAEAWLDRSTPPKVSRDAELAEGAPSERDALQRLPGSVAMLRAGHSRITGDLAGTMHHARRALELAAPDDHLTRGGASCLLGLASWEVGDVDSAHRSFEGGMDSLEKGGYISDVVGGAVTLADIRIAQGRLGDALRTYERGLQLALGQGDQPLRGAADMHVGMSEVLLERNDLTAAAQHLAASHDLGDENGLPKNPGRWRVAEADLRRAAGNVQDALDLLDQAEDVFLADFSPDVRPIAAVRARLWIADGRLGEAREWARSRRLTPEDEISYVREFEHATLARLLLAEGERERRHGEADQAIELTSRLVTAAERGGWTGAAIDALVVQALARFFARKDLPAALDALARAIAYAEPEGYVRIFVEEGVAMGALLREAAKHGLAPSYVGLLFASFTGTEQRGPRRQPLVEPLSEREHEVLRLLASDLSGPEIASHLVVSLNTVRTHTKSIYAKLAVNSRRAAVRRAAELELLATSLRH